METVLTVAQSKRLIAKGVKSHPAVNAAFNNGQIGICRGTTCSYVAEEFLDRPVDSFSYTIGMTLPKTPVPEVTTPDNKLHDIVIRKGEIHTDGEMVIEAVRNMNPGDVVIKGANALNYVKQVAGCVVGHPVGGTVGGLWGPVYGKKIKLIIPVGLEKEIGFDILKVSGLTMDENPSVTLMPMTGIIVTEIEAIFILSGASAYQIASGGVRGAEGAVRLHIEGTIDQIGDIKKILVEIENEPPY